MPSNLWYCEGSCYHPHLHVVLPAGGLAPDGSRWVACRPDFFLPVRVLSRRFRRLYLEGLKTLYHESQLSLSGGCRQLAEPKPWRRLMTALHDKEWVVYAKEPVCDPQHVLTYLARYTHRVAISNHRLVALQDGQVTFRFKDYKRRGQLRSQTLDALEFLRRFVLHVLPKGLHKIRYFGLLANCHRQQKLSHCRTLLAPAMARAEAPKTASSQSGSDDISESTWVKPGEPCPVCQKGQMQLVETFHRHQAAWDLSLAVPGIDSS